MESKPMQPPTSLTRAVKLRLGMILLLALVLRLILPIASWTINHDLELFWAIDTISYLEPAKSFIHSGIFADASGNPELNRPPGYPLILIPGIILNRLEVVTIALQIILSCATVLLVFCIGRIVFESTESALFGALLYAVEPLSIYYCSLLLSETLFTFLLILAIYLLLAWVRSGSVSYMVAAAFTMASSTYVRPISYYVPLLLALSLAVVVISKRYSLRSLHIVLFLLISVTALFIWQARNFIQTGYSGFSSQQDISLYYYQAGAVLAAKNKIPLGQQVEQLGEDWAAKQANGLNLSPLEELRWKRNEAINIILGHPLVFLTAQTRGIAQTFFGTSIAAYWKLLMGDRPPTDQGLLGRMTQPSKLHKIASLPSSALNYIFWECFDFTLLLSFYSLALLGILNCKTNHILVFLILVVTVYFVFFSSVQGYSRFRLPIMPFVAVLAGHGLTQLKEKLKERFARRATMGN